MPLYHVLPGMQGSYFLLNDDAKKLRGYRRYNSVVLDLPVAPALHSMPYRGANNYQLSATHLVPALVRRPGAFERQRALGQSQPSVTMSSAPVACDTPSGQSKCVLHGAPGQSVADTSAASPHSQIVSSTDAGNAASDAGLKTRSASEPATAPLGIVIMTIDLHEPPQAAPAPSAASPATVTIANDPDEPPTIPDEPLRALRALLGIRRKIRFA